MTWSARQYVRFEDERTRPVRDLLSALPAIDARRVIDLGCGPGNSTELLAARFAGAAVRGVDSSPDMLAAARQRLPALRFDEMDIARWAYDAAAPYDGAPSDAAARDDGAPCDAYDVILANAVLQWLPDHERLFPALVARVAAGGALAVQMPDNLEEPAHRLMRDIAADGPWASRLATAEARPPMSDASRYYDLLSAAGCKVDVWRTTYHHPLPGGADAVVEWFKGSGLRPYIAPLGDGERTAFLARYCSAIAEAYPAQPDGCVLLPFPRLFIVALH